VLHVAVLVKAMASKSDFVLKFEWARCHLDDLNEKLFEWRNSNPYSISREKHPNLPNHFTARITVQPIPPDPFALLIGDIVHNLRGTLDRLMYALASKHVKPFTQQVAEISEFPIFGDKRRKGIAAVEKDLFNGKLAPILNAIPPQAKTIIQRVQPYQRGKGFDSHPLWWLYELANIDKHRLLLTAALNQLGATFAPNQCINVDVKSLKIDVHGGELKDQTEIVTYHVLPIDPCREMYVDFHPAINVAFKCGSRVDGKDVIVTIGEILNYIVGYIVNPLVKFL
jgi:hypothetical protein